jgi:hypothetical protein
LLHRHVANFEQWSLLGHNSCRFHCEQTILEDEPRSGRPSLAEEPGIVAQVEALILSDRSITIEAIVHEVRISHGSVFNIIHDELHMTEFAARWVHSTYLIKSHFMNSHIMRNTCAYVQYCIILDVSVCNYIYICIGKKYIFYGLFYILGIGL